MRIRTSILVVALASLVATPAIATTRSETTTDLTTATTQGDTSSVRPEWAAPLAGLQSRSSIEGRTISEEEIAERQVAYSAGRDQAIGRIRLEDAVNGLPDRLLSDYPTSFAGAWVTASPNARVVVAFAGLRDLEAAASAVREMFAYPDMLDVIEVSRSYVDLEDLQEKVLASSILKDRTSFAVAIDEQTNGVTVLLGLGDPTGGNASEAAVVASELEVAFGVGAVAVEVREPFQAAACTRANCQWTMRGGLLIIRQPGGSGNPIYQCSTGFSMGQNSGSVILYRTTTAGHCNGGIGSWWKNDTNGHYGTVIAESFCNNCDEDASLIKWSTNPWVTEAKFIGNSTGDIRNVTSSACSGCYSVGQWAGVSGGLVGTRKGPQTKTNIAVNLGGGITIRELVEVNFCSGGWPSAPAGGNSGAAVFRNNEARGIYTANSGCYGYFTRQYNIEQEFSGNFTLGA